MRADRLIATLLLLQARGTVTASEVAIELEVSERTARRDLEALSAAGIPLYSSRGHGGGWRLLGGARTDLTGLRAPEAEALLMMAAVAGQSSPDFASAMQKLTQALPEPVRADARQAMAAIVSDDSPWHDIARSRSAAEEGQKLDQLRRAIGRRQRIELVYEARKGVSTRRLDPLGLISKRQTWYLLAATDDGHRTFRLDGIRSIEILDDYFDSPVGFDLEAAWDEVKDRFDAYPGRVITRAVLAPATVASLLASGIAIVVDSERTDGRVEATISAWTVDMLAESLAGRMALIELVDPPSTLTRHLGRVGTDLVARFGGESVLPGVGP